MEAVQHFPAEYLNTLTRYLNQFNFLGYYIFDDPTKSYFRRFGRVTFTMIYFFFCTTSQVLFLFWGQKQGASLFEIIIAIPFSILYVQAYAKLPLLLHHRETLKDVIAEMAELWPRDASTNKEKAAVMKFRLQTLKLVDKFLFVFSWSGLTTYNIIPTVFTIRSYWSEQPMYVLPLQMWFPWKTDSLPKWILSMFVQISYSAPLYGSLNLTTELLLLNLACDLGLLFRLLQIDLENMIQMNNEEDEVSHNGGSDLDDGIEILHMENRNDDKIKNLFRTHQRLLSIVDRLNSIFGIIIFNATFSSSILICLFCFLGLTAKGFDMVMYILSMIGMVFTIFNFAWPGQKLLDDSLGVADAAYKALWYERNLKFRKYVVIIMERANVLELQGNGMNSDAVIRAAHTALATRTEFYDVIHARWWNPYNYSILLECGSFGPDRCATAQQPCFLTALGFTNMTYDTLVTVFKTAFSYLSLLRQVYGEN